MTYLNNKFMNLGMLFFTEIKLAVSCKKVVFLQCRKMTQLLNDLLNLPAGFLYEVHSFRLQTK